MMFVSHSVIMSTFILVVDEKLLKKGAYEDRFKACFLSLHLKRNFNVLNSLAFKEVSVLCISLAINLRNSFILVLMKFKVI
jgi:hypothetical protein